MRGLKPRPLTTKNIQERGYSSHDLWEMKLDDQVLGPFDIESLKRYSKINKSSLSSVQVKRKDEHDWISILSILSEALSVNPAEGCFEESKTDQRESKSQDLASLIYFLTKKKGPNLVDLVEFDDEKLSLGSFIKSIGRRFTILTSFFVTLFGLAYLGILQIGVGIDKVEIESQIKKKARTAPHGLTKAGAPRISTSTSLSPNFKKNKSSIHDQRLPANYRATIYNYKYHMIGIDQKTFKNSEHKSEDFLEESVETERSPSSVQDSPADQDVLDENLIQEEFVNETL